MHGSMRIKATVIILNSDSIDVKEISSTQTQTHCILYSLLYNKKVYSLMMGDRDRNMWLLRQAM